MPGIVGLVQSGGTDVSETVAQAARTLIHLDSLTMRSGSVDDVGLAQVWRDEAHLDRDWFDDRDVSVRVAGHVLVDGASPKRLIARDLAAAYRAAGRISAEDYDGAFTIVVVDRTRRRLHVINDRVAALPVYFAHGPGRFAFGPEVKTVIPAAGIPAKLDRDGVMSFLIFGYSLADGSIFEGVKTLIPASILTVDLDTLAHHTQRYWNLRFNPQRKYRSRKAVESALYDTLLSSQRLVLCDNPASYELLLSGGLDSRGVLAFADVLGNRPVRTFTWGSSDAVPTSDAFVARRIAEHYQVPHKFLSYESRQFVDNAHDWIYVSELSNDNVGWFAEGQPTLASVYRSGVNFAIAGDVVWDSGGYAFNEMQMRRGVLPPGVPIPVAAVAREDSADDLRRVYISSIDAVLSACDHPDLTDRKEYLYVNSRLARYILSLGYYREHAVEVRRPFLSKAALELFASMPQTHRVEKNAYISMLNHRFPSLMQIPEQSLWSLPDWERDLRTPGPLRELWRHYLVNDRIEGGIMGKVLDLDRFAARRDAYFAAEPAPMKKAPFKARFPLRAKVMPIVQRYRAVDKLSRLIRTGPGFLPRSDFDLLRCTALVAMLEESLDRFARPAR